MARGTAHLLVKAFAIYVFINLELMPTLNVTASGPGVVGSRGGTGVSGVGSRICEDLASEFGLV